MLYEVTVMSIRRVLSLALALMLAVTAAGALADEKYNMPYDHRTHP